MCISSSRCDTGDGGTSGTGTLGPYVHVYVCTYAYIIFLTCMTASLQCRFNCTVHTYRECFLNDVTVGRVVQAM